MVSQDHYFSSAPGSARTLGSVSFELGGEPVTVQASSGTFSATRLDPGTAVLLEHKDRIAGDTLVDVGCGWGPIALTLGHAQPHARILAVDPNSRARELTELNARSLGMPHIQVLSPEEVPEELIVDQIWSNPPIRIGKAALHTLLTTWFSRLAPNGEAWLVVAKNLGADSLQRWINSHGAGAFRAERVSSKKGYRVFVVTRSINTL